MSGCHSEMPLAIDLFCGLGGWTEGLLAEGYQVIGFDIERHVYGEHCYPAQLVLQDVLTLHGQQFKDADLIVGSSPCQEFSYRAMPWKRAKALPPPELGMRLFHAQFRIQREACEATGHHIPMVVENVCGAQKWVGRARWHYGSYYLWGDVPALIPMVRKAVKVGGLDWNKRIPGQAFNTHAERLTIDGKLRAFPNEAADRGIKNTGGSWFGVAHNTTSGKGHNPDGRDGHAHCAIQADPRDHIKLGGSWFHDYRNGQGPRNHSSKSVKRKMASAMIAKIPFELARHIAHVYHPDRTAA